MQILYQIGAEMLHEMYSPVPGNITSFLVTNTTEVMIVFVKILFMLY